MTTECAKLGIPPFGPTLAVERELQVLGDLKLLNQIGPALPLLVLIIRGCARGDHCSVSYGEAAEQCGVHRSTVKNWANQLSRLNLITKKPAGPGGCTIVLSASLLLPVGLLRPVREALDEAVARLTSVRQVTEDAATAAINLLHETGERLG